jgi:hypothetical protein
MSLTRCQDDAGAGEPAGGADVGLPVGDAGTLSEGVGEVGGPGSGLVGGVVVAVAPPLEDSGWWDFEPVGAAGAAGPDAEDCGAEADALPEEPGDGPPPGAEAEAPGTAEGDTEAPPVLPRRSCPP